MSENNKKPLKDWLGEFYEDTAKLSEIVRNITLGGIAIIWIFKNSDLNRQVLPRELINPLKLFVLGIMSDVLQYLWRAINIYIIWKYKDWKYIKGKLTDPEIADVTMPHYIPIGSWIFFIAKILFATIAYYQIYFFLIRRM